MRQRKNWKIELTGKNLFSVILAILTLLYFVAAFIWVFTVEVETYLPNWGALSELVISLINLPLFGVGLVIITLYFLSITTQISYLIGAGSSLFLFLAVGYTLLVGTDLYLLLMYPIILYGFICYVILTLESSKKSTTNMENQKR